MADPVDAESPQTNRVGGAGADGDPRVEAMLERGGYSRAIDRNGFRDRRVANTLRDVETLDRTTRERLF